MVELSLRQKVFELLDNNPELKNIDIYEQYPKESQNSLRSYRTSYFRKLEESISKVKVSEKSTPNDAPKTVKFSIPEKKSYEHFCSLLNTFNNLPLFIYGQIVKKSFDQVDTIEEVTLSFYACFMEIIDDICNGYYDDQIMEYDSNVFENYLRMYCKIDKEDPEEIILNIDKNDYYDDYKRFIQDDLDLCNQNVIGYISSFNLMNPTLKEFKKLRSNILYYLFINQNHTLFLHRKPDISKSDIKEIVMEYNNCNEVKKSFIEDISLYNSNAIGIEEDTMTIRIEKDFYIDLGKHGEEYKKIYNIPIIDDNSGEITITGYNEVYFDNIEFV